MNNNQLPASHKTPVDPVGTVPGAADRVAPRKRVWKQRILGLLAWIAMLVLVFVAFQWLGLAVEARRAWRAGTRTEAEGSEILAQVYYERTIRNRSPMNLWDKRAAAALERLAETYEQHGALERAIDTYKGLRLALAAADCRWSRAREVEIRAMEEKIQARFTGRGTETGHEKSLSPKTIPARVR